MGNYKIINSATIKRLSQYRYWFSFFILAEFMILYCKDSLGCNDNNNINKQQTNKYFIIPRHYTVYKGSNHQTNT